MSQYAARRATLALQELAGRCVYGTLLFAALAAMLFLDSQLAQAVLGSTMRFAVTLAAIVSVLIGAPWFARWQIHRWARRVGREVPRAQWRGKPPSEYLPTAVLPGWFIAAFALMSVGGTALMGSLTWAFMQSAADRSLFPVVWLVAALSIGFCWTMAGRMALHWWRANGRACDL